MSRLSRRALLGDGLTVVAPMTAPPFAWAAPWVPLAPSLPKIPTAGVLSEVERTTLDAIVERLIPGDALSPSGKEVGCTAFIDMQLAGDYGAGVDRFMQGPFMTGAPEQGDQSPLAPLARYRLGLAALDGYAINTYGAPFAALAAHTRDDVLIGLETGAIALEGVGGRLFFEQVLQNAMEGFFADPIYGGNRDMASWRMIGFPGARYDYRAFVDKHGAKLDFPPLSIAGAPRWKGGL